jgi:hypothetical protein
VYEIPQSGKPDGQDTFEFTLNGHTHHLPRLKYLPIGKITALEKAGEDGQFHALLDLFGDPDTPTGKVLRSLDVVQFHSLIEAWQADSGVIVGEHLASTS